jgi:hypothetical protein
MALIASLMRVMPSDTWRPSTKAKPRPASVASARVVTMMATESRLPASAAAKLESDKARACCDASTAAAFMSLASRVAVD